MTERQFAANILYGETLADKLTHAEAIVADAEIAPPLAAIAAPGRPPGLRLGEQAAAAFPKQESLVDPGARGRILHFFANHELLALELMALALLRFPDAPPAFRRGIIRTMSEEQTHLRLYLDRMTELGVTFGDLGVSDFFWNALKGMRTPYDYVVGMSLTLEQANLDFSRHYQQLFAAAGDTKTAAILARVYREEIGHVKHGVVWFDQWRPADEDAWTSFTRSLRLPLSPARAKARPFNREGRRDAGLSDDFIRRLHLFGGSKGRPPTVLWLNTDVEMEAAHVLARDVAQRPWSAFKPPAHLAAAARDNELLMTFLAQEGDIVYCSEPPDLDLLEDWRELGIALPEYRVTNDPYGATRALHRERPVGTLAPWGFGPRALELAAALVDTPLNRDAARIHLTSLYAKTELPELRRQLRRQLPELAASLGPVLMDGRLVTDTESLRTFATEVRALLAAPILVKAPFSAAGRARIRIDTWDTLAATEHAWLAKAWRRWGVLLAEPLASIVADGSLLAGVAQAGHDARIQAKPVLKSSAFFCDGRGRYRGHWLTRRNAPPFPEPARSFLSTCAAPLAAAGSYALAATRANGLTGRAGFDFHVYRLPGTKTPDSLYLQPLGEINARTTMGHVALALSKLLAPGACGAWVILHREDLEQSGFTDFAALAHTLSRDLPRATTSPVQGLKQGILFTNAAKMAQQTLGVVAVGETALAALASLTNLPIACIPTNLSPAVI